MKDYYLILGVSRTATGEAIDAAFRKLARRYHPDLRPEEEDAAARFKSAVEAHEVLSDAEKRREYDRSHSRRKRRIAVDVGEGQRTRRASETVFQGWTKMPWTTAGRREVAPCGPSDVEAELRLVPEEAARGGPMEVRVSVSHPCSACKESGDARIESCAVCGGEGTIRQSRLLRLRLPPALRDGTVLCVAGHGKAAGPHSAGGNLYLRVRVRPCW